MMNIENNFKIGDKVKFINDLGWIKSLTINEIYNIQDIGFHTVEIYNDYNKDEWYNIISFVMDNKKYE